MPSEEAKLAAINWQLTMPCGDSTERLAERFDAFAAEAVRAEREACAAICDARAQPFHAEAADIEETAALENGLTDMDAVNAADDAEWVAHLIESIAAAIRERGKQ